jgi:hypothetical protein
MLDIDDITHVDSVIAREFPLHNCSSWNRIKNELVVVQKPAHNTGSPKLPCTECDGSTVDQVVDSKYWNYCPYCGRQLRASA